MKKLERGFTLMELMIALVIMGIVMAIAIPSLAQMLRVTRQKGVASDFFVDVMLARIEALKRARSVSICPTSDGTTCTGTATTWSNRRLIFVDQNSDGDLDAGEFLIRVSEGVKSDVTVATDSASTPSAFLRFRPIGAVVGGARVFNVSASGLEDRKVCIRATGQVSVSPPGQACP